MRIDYKINVKHSDNLAHGVILTYRASIHAAAVAARAEDGGLGRAQLVQQREARGCFARHHAVRQRAQPAALAACRRLPEGCCRGCIVYSDV